MRVDVLVEPQNIVWVVLFLDLDEAGIVRPIGRADKLVTRIAQLIDVHSMRKGLQSVARSLDPTHCIGLLCGSAPGTRDVYFITGLPQSKCRIARPYTAYSPTQRHNDHLAPWWTILNCRGNRRDCSLAEFGKEQVGLEVRNRR